MGKKNKKPDVSFGGQALIEGILMRSPNYYSIATVKKKKIKVKLVKEPMLSKKRFLNWFVIRGAVNLFQMLAMGIKALTYSANEIAEEDEKLTSKELIASIVISFLFGIGIFIIIPYFLTAFFVKKTGLLFNLIDGIIRIAFFLIYIYAMQFSKEVRRVFEFHGAEHATINAYEHNVKLTPNNVKKFATFHPRCGTSFIFIVLIISILVFSIVRSDSTLIKIASRIVLIPLIVGISYEFLKLSSKLKGVPFKILTYPGFLIQKITARKPDEMQIKSAIAALNAVVNAEKRFDSKNMKVR